MFKCEAEMQKWLLSELKKVCGLGELILPVELEGLIGEEHIVARNYKYCLDALNYTYLISSDENISLKLGDILRPDLLMYSSESEAIVIVELKNIKEPTRQAGTEVSAYAAEVRSYLPSLAGSDIINVVISNDWPVLLRHYVFNEVMWHKKNILCLKPVFHEQCVRLEVVKPSLLVEGDISFGLAEEHLGGFHICLYDMELYSGGSRERLDLHVEQMKTALRYIGGKGNSQGNNGFAFLWKYFHPHSLAPYMITVVNVAPFLTLERFLKITDVEPESVLGRLFEVTCEHMPTGHGASIGAQQDCAVEFLEKFCRPAPESFTDWSNLKTLIASYGELVSFQPWGFFESAYFDALNEEYGMGRYDVAANDPVLGMKVLQSLIDSNYQFINLSYYNYQPEEDLD